MKRKTLKINKDRFIEFYFGSDFSNMARGIAEHLMERGVVTLQRTLNEVGI